MLPSTSDLPQNQTFAHRYSIVSRRPIPGWRFNFAAGFAPLVAGANVLATTRLHAAGAGTTAYVELLGSVGGVNIVGAAIAVILVARFGLRDGQRWAWWFLAFCLLWIGVHDAVMTTRFFLATGQPFMLLPFTYCALMLTGLLKSRPAIFRLSTPQQSEVK
jgi:hypothetical protein